MHPTAAAPLAAAERAREATRLLVDTLFPSPRAFAVRLWDGTVLPTQGPPCFTLVIRSPGAVRRMFRPPLELALGEAFIRGDCDVEGDLFAALKRMNSLPLTRADLYHE